MRLFLSILVTALIVPLAAHAQAAPKLTLPGKVDSMEEARLSLGVHDVQEKADA